MNKLGFALSELPLTDTKDSASVDIKAVKKLVDLFIEQGGSYFDTAYTYNSGMSEISIGEALVKRYPRRSFQLADKMPVWMLEDEVENQKYFDEQLERCGVIYFDNYLIHWLNRKNYLTCLKMKSFEFLQRMRSIGRICHIGFTFHDKASVLEQILTEQPCVEFVQLQLNYLDWESNIIEARKCYNVCSRFGKHVIATGPLKGGVLAHLSPEKESLFKACHPEWSAASWAIRFAASLENVSVVLCGMSGTEQIKDNMNGAEPLNRDERKLAAQVADAMRREVAVPCGWCGSCTENCPSCICIPQYFALYNECRRSLMNDVRKLVPFYLELAEKYNYASACIRCRQCEKSCPRQIKITKWLAKVADVFET